MIKHKVIRRIHFKTGGLSTRVMGLSGRDRLCFEGCALDFACLPQSDKAVPRLNYMRQLGVFFLLLAASTLCARARVHEIEFDQARQVALTVGRLANTT